MPKQPRIAAAVTAAALCLSLTACGGGSAETKEPAANNDAASAASYGVAVEVQRVKSETIATDNKVSGRVVAEEESTIMVGVAAKCVAVYKDAGDAVRQGDILCTLDLASTLSQYSASQISYESAIQSYNDQKSLFDQQIAVAEKNVDVAARQIEVTREQIAVNERQIPVTEEQISVQEKQIPVLQNQISVQEAQIPVVERQIEAAEEQLAAGEAQIPILEQQIELQGPQIALKQKAVSDTEALFQIGAASQTELDSAKIQADQAVFARDQLRAQLKTTEAQLDSSRAQIEQSRYSIQQLRAQITQSRYSLEQLQAQIASSKFSVEQMRAQIDQAKFNLTQLELQRDNAQLSVDQLKSTRASTLSQLEAGIENARAGVQQLDSVLQDVDQNGNVIAPISGTLVTLNAVENSYVSNAAPVAVIHGENDMKVTASVSEALVPKLSTGDDADVYVSALNRSMTAHIRSIERAANAQTRLYTVTLTLSEPSPDLLAGMFADVTFHTDRVQNAVVVPSEAILTNGDTRYVYIAVGGVAKYVEVKTGLTGVGVTEILSGLDGGEYLITVGQTYVNDGADVRVVNGF